MWQPTGLWRWLLTIRHILEIELSCHVTARVNDQYGGRRIINNCPCHASLGYPDHASLESN